MPRNRRGGSLASYFYDAAGDGVGLGEKYASNMVNEPANITPGFLQEWRNGKWMGPGPEPSSGPPKPGKSRRTRRKKSNPAGAAQVMSENMKRHARKQDKKAKLASMKKHFKQTEILLDKNTQWPMHYTHSRIDFYINQCKEEIQKAKSHTGAGSHKLNSEAVHKKLLHETDGWSFKAIFTDISQLCANEGVKNHLALQKPMTAEGETGMYVNVVLAWLFAAKRQAMTALAKFIQDQPSKTPDMIQFLEENKKGIAARADYRADKEFLGPRHHAHPYDLHDRTILARQHEILYG